MKNIKQKITKEYASSGFNSQKGVQCYLPITQSKEFIKESKKNEATHITKLEQNEEIEKMPD